jgi:hypothetical protein
MCEFHDIKIPSFGVQHPDFQKILKLVKIMHVT